MQRFDGWRIFLSTPSARRATDEDVHSQLKLCISIHALREEGDLAVADLSVCPNRFLSTPSARRATGTSRQHDRAATISIHALREEGDAKAELARLRIRISIHALREEGDISAIEKSSFLLNFYPRPPRGGRRCPASSNCRPTLFLSTPSARRATTMLFILSAGQKISIHALREEGDRVAGFFFCHSANFYPRPPRGGRPGEEHGGIAVIIISIHALREEGDGASSTTSAGGKNFYPRPPRGGRRYQHPR